jgi:hypothetical protein
MEETFQKDEKEQKKVLKAFDGKIVRVSVWRIIKYKLTLLMCAFE